WPGLRHHASRHVDGDPTDVFTAELALTGVDAGPDLEPKSLRGFREAFRTADRTRRTIERSNEPVAGGVHLAASQALERQAKQTVVLVEQIAPAAVAHPSSRLRRRDNVGKEQRAEHAIR